MSVPISYPLVAAAFALVPSALAGPAPATLLPSIPDPIGFAGAFAGVHRRHLIAGGGANFPDGVMPWNGGRKVWSDRLFILDLNTPGATWKELGKLPARNGYGVSLTINEGILLIGGSDETHHLADVQLMTLDEHDQPNFRELPSLPKALAQMAGALVGRKVHICGGITAPTDTTALANHWILDLDSIEHGWIEAAALPAPGRILATAAAVGNEFIIAGGCALERDGSNNTTKRTYLTDAWKFAAGSWSRIADLPRPSVAAASPAPVSGDSFFIVSGDDGKQTGLPSPTAHRGFTAEILRCDVSSNQWSAFGNLEVPPPVTLPTAPWNGGSILFNGEIKPGVRTPQVIYFKPAP